MTACKCVRCGMYWSFTSGPAENFTAVTRFCPTCIALLPRYGGGV